MILVERLFINGVETPITDYNVTTPTGGLGESLTVGLAKPDPSLVPGNISIKFEIGAGKETSPGVVTYSWKTILDSARRDGRQYSARWIEDSSGGFPGDVLQITAMSPFADKWSLSPNKPIIMYDPSKVEQSTLASEDESQLLRRYDSGGGVTFLYPYLEAVGGLSLYNVLDRAYTNRSPLAGMGPNPGFSRVITNIPNYQVERVDINPESGWHGAVSGLYSSYKPVVFESDGVLYIIDPSGGLPPGFTPRNLEADCVIELNETFQAETMSNAVILSYKQNPGGGSSNAGEIPSIRYITEEYESPNTGRAYTRTKTQRKITEFKDIVSGELRRTEENEITTETYGYRDNIAVETNPETGEVTRTRGAGSIRLVSREVIINRYTGNVKSSHTRTVEGLYYDPDFNGEDKFGDLYEEECQLIWSADPNHPGSSILRRSATQTRGLVLVESKEDGLEIYTPILDATNNGIVESDGSQTVEWMPIKEVVEELKDTGINQSNIVTRVTDFLVGGPAETVVQSRTGSRSTYMPPFARPGQRSFKAGTIREMVTDDASIAAYGLRKPESLDVGDIGPVEGRKLARRQLAAKSNPPLSYSLTLPGIDFFIRRGSLLRLPKRAGGYTPPMLVTGYSRYARAIGTDSQSRGMSLDLTEVIYAGN